MPFTMPNFQIQQGNPFVQGILQGTQSAQNAAAARQAMLQASIVKAQLPYAGQQAQQDLLKSQLANQYQPQLWKSEIGLRGAQTNQAQQEANYVAPKAKAQIAEAYAEMDYKKKLAKVEQIKADNPGLLGDASAQDIALSMMSHKADQDKARQSSSQGANQGAMNYTPIPQSPNGMPNGQQNLGAPMVPGAPQGQPNLYDKLANADISQKEGMANYYQQGGGRGGVDLQEARGLQSQLMQEHGWNAATAQQAASAYLQGQNKLPDGRDLPEPSGLDQQLLETMMKRRWTSSQIAAQTGASKVGTLMDMGDDLVQDAAKYSGVSGRAKFHIDQALEQKGAAPPEYTNYLKFTRQIIPSLLTPMIQEEGGHATDQQKAWMKDIANPIYLDTHPEVVMDMWNYAKKTYKDKLAPLTVQGGVERTRNLKDRESTPLEKALIKKKDLVYDPRTGKIS